MYKIHDEIKDRLRSTGRTITQLSIALEIQYDQLGHYLNGRRELPDELATRIDVAISDWEDVQT